MPGVIFDPEALQRIPAACRGAGDVKDGERKRERGRRREEGRERKSCFHSHRTSLVQVSPLHLEGLSQRRVKSGSIRRKCQSSASYSAQGEKRN